MLSTCWGADIAQYFFYLSFCSCRKIIRVIVLQSNFALRKISYIIGQDVRPWIRGQSEVKPFWINTCTCQIRFLILQEGFYVFSPSSPQTLKYGSYSTHLEFNKCCSHCFHCKCPSFETVHSLESTDNESWQSWWKFNCFAAKTSDTTVAHFGIRLYIHYLQLSKWDT